MPCWRIQRASYDQILCCGDLVGYGADPNTVVEWVREQLHGSRARQSR